MDKLSDDLLLKRVTNDWVNTVHGREKKFAGIHKILLATWSNPPVQQHGKAHDFLKQYIAHYLPNIARKPKYGAPNDRPTYTFPGPMAVQLNRKHLSKIRNNDYFITEKSDGVRSMMLNIYEKEFPRWMKNGVAVSLNDTCSLESLSHYASSTGGKAKIVLDDRREHEVDFTAQTIKATDSTQAHKLRRHKGWNFSYFFDRNFEFYLSWEEFVFITRQTQERIDSQESRDKSVIMQGLLLLDGEIVFNLREQRYNYSVYDVALSTSETPNQNRLSTQVFSFVNEPMSRRAEEIRKGVSDPHYCFYSMIARTNPPRLQLLPKRFYPKDQLEQVLSYIKRDPKKKGLYIYKDYNHNDGLVFTPDSGSLYPFLPGKNDNLLKWKWPDRLSADFKVVRDQQSSDPRSYYLYFSNRDQEAYYRQATLEIEDELLTELQQKQNGAVLECIFKVNVGWCAELIRHDKATGNGFLVISSTLENMIENITTNILLDVCSSSTESENDMQQEERLQEIFENAVIQRGAVIHLRLCPNRKKGTINVQYNVPSQYSDSDWPLFMRFTDCFWDEKLQADQVAEQAFYEQEKRFLFVQVIFVPHLGKYKILNFNGMQERCTCTHLLMGLETMITIYDGLKKSNLRPGSEDTRQEKKRKNN
jgi:hypothetical protein